MTQKDKPEPPQPQQQPWNDDTDWEKVVTDPGFHDVDPDQPLPPSGPARKN